MQTLTINCLSLRKRLKTSIRKDTKSKENKEVLEIEHLTGYGYEASGRTIRCHKSTCMFLFKRHYDLERHVANWHPELLDYSADCQLESSKNEG